MRSTPAIRLRALPLLAALAATPALAEPATADIAQMLQTMQERLNRLETRNAELERRLAEAAPATKDEALKARVEDLENEVVALTRKPDPLERFEGVSVGASLVMVAQKATGGVEANELNARADVEVELPMGSIGDAEGFLFAHLRAGDGEGLDTGAFATSNSMVFGDINSPVLMQAWYQLNVPVGGDSGNLGQVEFTVGKIDPFGFFDGNNVADDESEQFLNLAFIHNPLLDAGGDIGVGEHGASPGMRLAYVSDINGGNNVTASLGLFGAGEGADFTDSFVKPLAIGQLEYAGKTIAGMEGTYRLYGWSNGSALALDGVTEERHTGWGVSIDQRVSDHVTLFTRVGLSTKGEVGFDRAYTLGAQLDGGLWGRKTDHIGLAAGWLKASDESGMTGTEKPLELYYAWHLNDHIQLSPSVQWIREPGGDTSADSVTVWGLRAKASY